VLREMFVRTAGGARAADLVPFAQRWRPEAVLHEAAEFAAPVAAAVTGARLLTCGTGLLVPTAPLTGLLRPALDALYGRWGVPDGTTHLLTGSTFLDVRPPTFATGAPVAFALRRPLRPEQPPPAAGERLPAAVDRLPRARSVHVTLGTVVHDVPGVLDAVLAGLRDEPVNLLVGAGPGTRPARPAPHVVVAPYLPHPLVLPRCAAVVSHAGAGTLLATLAHGLPSVLLPQAAEQEINAAAAAQAGVAVVLGPGAVTPDGVRGALAEVLGDPRYAAAALRVRTEIAAMPSAARTAAGFTGA
jgi:UDP:flavonoid glycosyltransferase YjiC (YdhE family)